jgi:hypothetical protein
LDVYSPVQLSVSSDTEAMLNAIREEGSGHAAGNSEKPPLLHDHFALPFFYFPVEKP